MSYTLLRHVPILHPPLLLAPTGWTLLVLAPRSRVTVTWTQMEEDGRLSTAMDSLTMITLETDLMQ